MHDLMMTPQQLLSQSTRTPARPAAVAQVMEWHEANSISAEWEELSQSCVEPNPFLEPAFALSLAQHCAPERRPRFLTVREAAGERRLTGLFALERSGACSWNSPMIPLHSPLLRRGAVRPALSAAFTWLDENSASSGFLFTRLDARGPTCRAILIQALRNGLPVQEFSRHKRAALAPGEDGEAQQASGKRRKELARLLRRLQDKGAVTFSSARKPSDVRNAVERFLELEGAGWKGRKGTALVSNPMLSTFTRSALRRLADDNRCRIETMHFNGRPIAMGVVLVSQDHAAFWKIAFDENFAAYSPGVQLTLEIGRNLVRDPGVRLADSCAIPDHPMIDHLWRDRREMIDLFVGGRDPAAFEREVQIEYARRGLRRVAKSAYLTLTRRRPPVRGVPATGVE